MKITPEELEERGWEGQSGCMCQTDDGLFRPCPPQLCEAEQLYARVTKLESLLNLVKAEVDSVINRIGPSLYEKTPLSNWTQEQVLRELEFLQGHIRQNLRAKKN